jgi:hypothetical protein
VGGGDRLVDPGLLRRGRRDLEHARLAQPRVLAAPLEEGPHRRRDPIAGAAQPEGALVAEKLPQHRHVRPVSVDEAAVAAARAPPAGGRLEHRHAQLRRAAPQGKAVHSPV